MFPFVNVMIHFYNIDIKNKAVLLTPPTVAITNTPVAREQQKQLLLRCFMLATIRYEEKSLFRRQITHLTIK